MLRRPYFLEDKDWYEYDEETEKFVLTENAPFKAVESYKQYLKDYERAVLGYIGTDEDEEEIEKTANLFGL